MQRALSTHAAAACLKPAFGGWLIFTGGLSCHSIAGLVTTPQRLFRTSLGGECESVPEKQSCSCLQGLIHYNGLAKPIKIYFPYLKILPFPTSPLKTLLFHWKHYYLCRSVQWFPAGSSCLLPTSPGLSPLHLISVASHISAPAVPLFLLKSLYSPVSPTSLWSHVSSQGKEVQDI